MKLRHLATLTVVALALAVAAPSLAFAGDHGTFPMAAAEFHTRFDPHTKTAREHMDKRAADLDANAAKELRAKFEAGVAKVNDEIAKATADGTVTEGEAKPVR